MMKWALPRLIAVRREPSGRSGINLGETPDGLRRTATFKL